MGTLKEISMTPSSLLGILTILLIALKLTGHIDCSWWYIVSPVVVVSILEFIVVFKIWQHASKHETVSTSRGSRSKNTPSVRDFLFGKKGE